MSMFEAYTEVHRIALNLDQITTYNPPPNPAKITDSRCTGYVKQYGTESWELDALNPQIIERLIKEEVSYLTDFDLLEERRNLQEQQKKSLTKYAEMADEED